MAYFLRLLDDDDRDEDEARRETEDARALSPSLVAQRYGQLTKLRDLRQIALAEDVARKDRTTSEDVSIPAAHFCAPSTSFGLHAIARQVVLRHWPETSQESPETTANLQSVPSSPQNSGLVALSLHCLFSLLDQLATRDLSLCSSALSSLFRLLQSHPPGSLMHEPKETVDAMMSALRQLRQISNSPDVTSSAGAVLAALAIAVGSPTCLSFAASTLLIDAMTCETEEELDVPENLRRLHDHLVESVFRDGPGRLGDFWSLAPYQLAACLELDVSSLICSGNDASSSLESTDERRLYSGLASDGTFVYLLTHAGLFKLGTGFCGTIRGRAYASTNHIRASPSVWLAICQGSLYLRRAKSSRLWVLDTDTLREVGEIMLSTAHLPGCLFSDGISIYHAHVEDPAHLVVRQLDDTSFSPVESSARRFRLTLAVLLKQGHVPAEDVLDSLPKQLLAQSVDVQLWQRAQNFVWLVQTRGGRAYYSHATNGWMQLIVGGQTDAIRQMACGVDSTFLLLRTAGGRLWLAANDDAGGGASLVLQRIHLPNRKRVAFICSTASKFGCISDGGAVFLGGFAATDNPEPQRLVQMEQMLELAHVNVTFLAIGRRHCAAISKHGHLYTWGLNNVGQCGRVESAAEVPVGKVEELDGKAIHVALGAAHTLVLMSDKRVVGFGSNRRSQLSANGDSFESGQKVDVPPIQRLEAGAHHSVFLTVDGSLLVFGLPQPQLPATRTIWISAQNDFSLALAEERLLTESLDPTGAHISASQHSLLIFPSTAGRPLIAIDRTVDDHFRAHPLRPHDLYSSWTLDGQFGVLWRYSAAEQRLACLLDGRWNGDTLKLVERLEDSATYTPSSVSTYAGGGNSNQDEGRSSQLRFLLSPEWSVPSTSVSSISLGTHLLATAMALTYCSSDRKLAEKMTDDLELNSNDAATEQFHTITRFSSEGGGWGYAAHSIEAIEFRCDRDILLHGAGLYAGRGQYLARIRLVRVTQGDVCVLSESDEKLVECAPRCTVPFLFPRPVACKANVWYTVCARLSGPSSDCGAGGRGKVETGNVTFEFRDSTLSNNGTDAQVGQLPELLFSLPGSRKPEERAADTSGVVSRAQLSQSIQRLIDSRIFLTATESSIDTTRDLLTGSITQLLLEGSSPHLSAEEELFRRERTSALAVICARMLRIQICYRLKQEFDEEDEDDDTMQRFAATTDALNGVFDLWCSSRSRCDSPARRAVLSATFLWQRMLVCVPTSLLSAYLGLLPRHTHPHWRVLAILRAATGCDLLKELISKTGDKRALEAAGLPVEAPDLKSIFQFLIHVVFAEQSSVSPDWADVALSAVHLLDSFARQLVQLSSPTRLASATSRKPEPETTTTTPSRFRGVSSNSWQMTAGASDAIGIRSDQTLKLHGVVIFRAPPGQPPTSVLLEVMGPSGRPMTSCAARIQSANEDEEDELTTATVRFSEALTIEKDELYILKMTAKRPALTYAGEAGVTTIRISPTCRILFEPAPAQSTNGTTEKRGQLPAIIVSWDTVPDRDPRDEESVKSCASLFVHLLRNSAAEQCERLEQGELTADALQLMERLCARAEEFSRASPERALAICAATHDLLSTSAALNKRADSCSSLSDRSSATATIRNVEVSSRRRKMVVQTTHPYAVGEMSCYLVRLGSGSRLKLVSISWSPRSRLAPSDRVLVYAHGNGGFESPAPVAVFDGKPTSTNFSLITASDSLWFVLDSAPNPEATEEFFGYECTLSWWPRSRHESQNPKVRLERELVWLAAQAARQLVTSSLGDADVFEERLALATAHDARMLSKRRKEENAEKSDDLDDFVSLRTSGSRKLAEFLCFHNGDERFVDLAKCRVVVRTTGRLDEGSPVKIELQLRDQFGRQVKCDQPISGRLEIARIEGESRYNVRVSSSLPSRQLVQQVLTRNRMSVGKLRFHSLSMQSALSNWSDEELRLAVEARVVNRIPAEEGTQIRLDLHKDASLSALSCHWIPDRRLSGTFSLSAHLDGEPITTQDVLLEIRRENPLDESSVRSGKVSPSAGKGVRIRRLPSLSAATIGFLAPLTMINFMDETENEFGRWARPLDLQETGWVLIYHAQLGKRLVEVEQDPIQRMDDARWVQVVMQQEEDEEPNGNLTSSNSGGAVGHLRAKAERALFAALLWQADCLDDVKRAESMLDNNVTSHPLLDALLALWKEARQRLCVDRSIGGNNPSFLEGDDDDDDAIKGGSGGGGGGNVCELCPENGQPLVDGVSLTQHMRSAHPGCSGSAHGCGYNSSGRYSTGWAGNCGAGGVRGQPWYLLCPRCRQAIRGAKRRPPQRKGRGVGGGRLDERRLVENVAFILRLDNSSRTENYHHHRHTEAAEKQRQQEWSVNLYPSTSLKGRKRRQTDQGVPPRIRAVTSNYALTAARFQQLASSSWTHHQALDWRPSEHISSFTSDPGPSTGGRTTQQQQETHVPHVSSALRNMIAGDVYAQKIVDFVTDPDVVLDKIEAARRADSAFAQVLLHSISLFNWLASISSDTQSLCSVVFHYLEAMNSAGERGYSSAATVLELPDRTPLKLGLDPRRLVPFADHTALKRLDSALREWMSTLSALLAQKNVEEEETDDLVALRSLLFKVWTRELVGDMDQDATCAALTAAGDVLQNGVARGELSDELDPCSVREMQDVTQSARVDVCSRPAMRQFLVDGSSETFWESAPRSSRSITIELGDSIDVVFHLLSVLVDNRRDAAHATTSIAAVLLAEDGETVLMERRFDAAFCGWFKCSVPGQPAAGKQRIRLSFAGPAPTTRIRRLVVFGFRSSFEFIDNESDDARILNLESSLHADAFDALHAIAVQAFTRPLAGSHLGEQLVSVLYENESSLNPEQSLQAHVARLMTSALEKEVVSLLSDQSTRKSLGVARNLVLLLGRSVEWPPGARALRPYADRMMDALAQLATFVPHTLCVDVCAAILTTALSNVSTTHEAPARLVRCLLAVVAKAMTVQVRLRAVHKLTTATLAVLVSSPLSAQCETPSFQTDAQNPPSRWNIARPVSAQSALVVRQLLMDLSTGAAGDLWSEAVRLEVADRISWLGLLVKKSDPFVVAAATSSSSPSASASSSLTSRANFWLSIAALAVLLSPDWLQLSDGWRLVLSAASSTLSPSQRVICENHDDGKTAARLRCLVCDQHLCAACHSVLHLSKKTREHPVEWITGVERSPSDRGGLPSSVPPPPPPAVQCVDGCVRVRMQHLQLLVRGSELCAMVEVNAGDEQQRSGGSSSNKSEKRCRFCDSPDAVEDDGACRHPDCRQAATIACRNRMECGHFCAGVEHEQDCLGCLRCSPSRSSTTTAIPLQQNQDADDACVICWSDRLSGAPVLRLECGHLLHAACVRSQLEKRWSATSAINFRFMHCPLCNRRIRHWWLDDLLRPLDELRLDVERKARLRLLHHEGKTDDDEDEETTTERAMLKYVYVLCARCGRAYFGGEASCQQALSGSLDASSLLCGGCSAAAALGEFSGAEATEILCARHGDDYLEWKCRFCCSVAVYFCFGSTHFCAACHSDFERMVAYPVTELPHCPAGPKGVQLPEGPCPLRLGNHRHHPPAGKEFPLGCAICRNLSTF